LEWILGGGFVVDVQVGELLADSGTRVKGGGVRTLGGTRSCAPCAGAGSGGWAVVFRFLALTPTAPPPAPAPDVWDAPERVPPIRGMRGNSRRRLAA